MSTSSLYKTLTTEELTLLVKRHFHTETFEASLLQGGMFNTTYLLKGLPEGQKMVLRLGPVNRHLLLPFEDNLMNGEVNFYELCRQVQVPVSEVYCCDTTKTVLDRDYMMVPFIESSVLSSLTLEAPAKQALYRQTGQYAAAIHSIKGTQFGRLSKLTSGEGYDTWYGFLKSELNEWAKKASCVSIFSPAEISAFLEVFEAHAELFEEITTPRLLHVDLWEGNILVREEDGQYDVCAIIDGDRAVFGDTAFEFASGWMINDAFLEGYGTKLSMAEDDVLRRTLYSILYSISDSYICHAEYNNQPECEKHKARALTLLSDILKKEA